MSECPRIHETRGHDLLHGAGELRAEFGVRVKVAGQNDGRSAITDVREEFVYLLALHARGLRDAWELSIALRESADPGDARTLGHYAASRRLDAQATIRVTDALAGAFLGSNRLLRAARGVALSALDVLPGPRRFFARRMIYGPSALP